jgi:glycosyltransferase involved in cell wall biosynthesis
MIVRNEEANLPACLESVRGLFDEAVIVDTGSTDRTVKIARAFGARVYRFPWCDDFAAARNHGLEQVRTDWWFRMDADDRLPASQRKRFARGLERIGDEMAAYVFSVYSVEHTGTETVVQEFRLFPRACRFRGRVHERVRLEDYAHWLKIARSDVRIDHVGYTDRETYYAKLRRNYRILAEEIKRPPVDCLTWFDLGRTESALEYHDAALGSLETFLALPTTGQDSARRVAHRIIVDTHREQGRLADAMTAVQRGLEEYPDDYMLTAWLADIVRAYGHLDIAKQGYELALELYDKPRLDSGISVDFRALTAGALASVTEQIRTAPPPAAVAPAGPDPGHFSLQSLLAV